MFNPADKIEGFLKSKQLEQFKVSSKFDERLLSAVQKREFGELPDKSPSYSDVLIQTFLGRFRRYAVAMAMMALVATGGVFYYHQNSYSYHLNKAKVYLAHIEEAIGGQLSKTAFIPNALAEGEAGTVDETLIAHLTGNVVDETGKAIEAADNLSRAEKMELALEEISQVQEKEIEIFSAATEVVGSEEAIEALSEALEITGTQQELVEKARGFVKNSLKRHEAVKIDIEISGPKGENGRLKKIKNYVDDNERLIRAKTQFEEAKGLLTQLKLNAGDERGIGKLEDRLDQAEDAFNQGKIGKAFGLSIAIKVQSESMLRKSSKTIKDYE